MPGRLVLQHARFARQREAASLCESSEGAIIPAILMYIAQFWAPSAAPQGIRMKLDAASLWRVLVLMSVGAFLCTTSPAQQSEASTADTVGASTPGMISYPDTVAGL
jgi:hypothetical protein